MNKYKVIYGYCHPNAFLTHCTKVRMFNTFDEAKEFIINLPKVSTRIGFNCKCTIDKFGFAHPNKEVSNLYAKIRCKGKDFWIEGNKDDVFMNGKIIKSNNPKAMLK